MIENKAIKIDFDSDPQDEASPYIEQQLYGDRPFNYELLERFFPDEFLKCIDLDNETHMQTILTHLKDSIEDRDIPEINSFVWLLEQAHLIEPNYYE